jgi:hypothetical protein
MCNFQRTVKGFMETDVIVSLLTTCTYEQSHNSIPDGIKTDVFFVIKKNDNVTSAKQKNMCVYGHPTDPIFQPLTLTFFIGNYSTP